MEGIKVFHRGRMLGPCAESRLTFGNEAGGRWEGYAWQRKRHKGPRGGPKWLPEHGAQWAGGVGARPPPPCRWPTPFAVAAPTP